MSRIPEYDGCDDVHDQLRSWAFTGNIERSLRGRKGQKFLRELEAALLALPEKEIVAGTFHDGDKVCPLGAVYVQRRLAKGLSREEAFADMDREIGSSEDRDEFELIEAAGSALGICTPLAYAVIAQADEWISKDATPEVRYGIILQWVRGRISHAEKWQKERIKP